MHRLPIGRTILLLALTGSLWWWWGTRPIHHAPGVLVAATPVQVDELPRVIGTRDGFALTAVARYSLQARVLGTKRYHSGVQSELVPVDVAVGWGRMSDQSVLDQLRLTMGNRFFFYQWHGRPPLPVDEIMCHATNNHVIAANSTVGDRVKRLRVGQIVTMHGWLVDATGPDGFRWNTSRRRDDTGNGACELFYVEKVDAWDQPSEAEPGSEPAVLQAKTKI